MASHIVIEGNLTKDPTGGTTAVSREVTADHLGVSLAFTAVAPDSPTA